MKSSIIHFCEKMKLEKIEKSTYLIPMRHLKEYNFLMFATKSQTRIANSFSRVSYTRFLSVTYGALRGQAPSYRLHFGGSAEILHPHCFISVKWKINATNYANRFTMRS